MIHIVHKAIPSDGCKDAIFLYKAEEGKPYTITAFTEDGQPIYGEGELEVEIPEGYWEQFEPQQAEEVVEEPIVEEKPIEVGDEIIVDGKTMRCVAIVDGVPQWTVIA